MKNPEQNSSKLAKAEGAANNARRRIAEFLNKEDSKVNVSMQTTTEIVRQVGDKWTDEYGYEWTQHNGWKSRESKHQSARMPLWCPKCNGNMNHRFDTKMYGLHGMCYDCVIKFETKLRLEGKWEEYESRKLKDNMLSFLKNQRDELVSYIKELRKPEFLLADDKNILEVEKWEVDLEVIRNDMQEDIKKIEEAIEVLENENIIQNGFGVSA